MHCRVAGKEFAALIERQNTDIKRSLKVEFPGMTLASRATLSTPTVPAKTNVKDQPIQNKSITNQHNIYHIPLNSKKSLFISCGSSKLASAAFLFKSSSPLLMTGS